MLIGETKSGLKFTLRKFKKSDVSDLAKSINNKKIIQNLANVPYPYTKKDAVWWINQNIYGGNKDKLNLVIDLEGRLAGSIGITSLVPGHKGHLGYWLAEEHWEKGIMTEVTRVFTDYCFKEFNLIRIYGSVYDWNLASARVIEKNGFVKEGILRNNVKNLFGKLGDEWVYGKVK
ncbi:GNAT family N-acetyltransferase [Candidatus Woesearchaeota archaeon]|jgi:[ribosomal protein S5]-alanine N-acetyltransferase|nr:GNAT family N-acetyltransferase [Candidatus Woesearchaeota archaeon]MBT6023326.1 GNAT family N-acetyltransferase [Candidatus Woesearchaeota archaeon]